MEERPRRTSLPRCGACQLQLNERLALRLCPVFLRGAVAAIGEMVDELGAGVSVKERGGLATRHAVRQIRRAPEVRTGRHQSARGDGDVTLEHVRLLGAVVVLPI